MARAETCSPGIAESGSTLSKPQDVRRGMAPQRKGAIKEIHSGMGRQPNPLEGPEKQSWDCRCWFPTPRPAGEIFQALPTCVSSPEPAKNQPESREVK